MNLLDFSIHLVCSTICVVISIFMFVIHIKQERERSFVKVRRYLAYSILIDSITYFMSAVFISMGVDSLILKKFFVHAAFYFQMYLMTFALIELLFSHEVTKRKKQLMPLPVLILSALYFAGYIAYSGNNFSIVSYICFLETTAAHTISRILVYVTAAEIIVCMFWLVKASIGYRKGIGNYFSGSQAIGGSRLPYIIHGFIAYVFFQVMGNFAINRTVDLFLISLATLTVFVLTLTILNKKTTYVEMSPAFEKDLLEFDDTPSEEMIEHDTCQLAPEIAGAEESENQDIVNVNADEAHDGKDLQISIDRRRIEDLIHAWAERPEKPYLAEGLTLAKAADEIGISSRFLSGFLNDIYEMNFNAWINNLRIEEVKRLIDAGTGKSMTDLAVMAGFTDLSAMSRIFKRITGITPSMYRSESQKDTRIQA